MSLQGRQYDRDSFCERDLGHLTCHCTGDACALACMRLRACSRAWRAAREGPLRERSFALEIRDKRVK